MNYLKTKLQGEMNTFRKSVKCFKMRLILLAIFQNCAYGRKSILQRSDSVLVVITLQVTGCFVLTILEVNISSSPKHNILRDSNDSWLEMIP